MTIIAVKDGTMACDSMAFLGSLRCPVRRPKIHQRADGAIIGCAGTTSLCDRATLWFINGEDYDKAPIAADAADDDLSFLMLRPDGRVIWGNARFDTFEVSPTYAVGAESACMMAMGAMLAGASVVDAVQIAIDHTVWVGGKVYSLNIKNNF